MFQKFSAAVLLCLLLIVPVGAAPVGAEQSSPILRAFASRVEFARAQLPATQKAAQAVADRIVAHPLALIDVPYTEQPGFAEEVLNRAGGLANTLPTGERPTLATPDDIRLISARDWEDDAPKVEKMVADSRKNGQMTILFASRAGMPADVQVDYLVDNGAQTPGKAEAPVNAIANILNAWLWTCEYASALTRHGKYPGVLLSIILPESDAHNAAIQGPETRRFLGDTATPVAPLVLANQYLARVEELLKQLPDARTQSQLDNAARLIVAQLAAGKKVALSTCTHILLWEIFDNRRTPIQPFNIAGIAKTAFPANAHAGDLVVWIGYVGMSTKYEDYGAELRGTGAKFISCYVTDKNAANNAPDAAAHIEQHWAPPDAAVPVPFSPGAIAPISGIDESLLYRMLEDKVAARLSAATVERRE